jgi:putative glutathione S-transferase
MAKAQFAEEQDDSGSFERQEDSFREWIGAGKPGSRPFEAGRYHLYVSLACPWASRTVIARKLLHLENSVGLTVVDPVRDERGWAFRNGPGYTEDPINNFKFLSQAYLATDPNFSGRVTVPVLWDKQDKKIVNNSEDDICRIFNEISPINRFNLFPPEIAPQQDELSQFIYETINNGVYRAGFATRQKPYEAAVKRIFEALDQLEDRLTKSRYLFGNRLVESDWRLFCTLVRFDAVYYVHFKCNIRRILDYPNLNGYQCDLYQHPGISETVNMDHIKRHYYITHTEINPFGIVPAGPELNFNKPHNRDNL